MIIFWSGSRKKLSTGYVIRILRQYNTQKSKYLLYFSSDHISSNTSSPFDGTCFKHNRSNSGIVASTLDLSNFQQWKFKLEGSRISYQMLSNKGHL